MPKRTSECNALHAAAHLGQAPALTYEAVILALEQHWDASCYCGRFGEEPRPAQAMSIQEVAALSPQAIAIQKSKCTTRNTP